MSVRLISGANSESLNLNGQTVAAIRERFASAFTISPAAGATINGETADETETVYDGDTLQFVKETAEKG